MPELRTLDQLYHLQDDVEITALDTVLPGNPVLVTVANRPLQVSGLAKDVVLDLQNAGSATAENCFPPFRSPEARLRKRRLPQPCGTCRGMALLRAARIHLILPKPHSLGVTSSCAYRLPLQKRYCH